ncbi:apolipoprotein N-acyltransferase [uncultured Algimonas sp.]|uniref:apolipoprotein N-acyltransferase n=1 Tax=uncultured Algimonas sp. TaxID=1547920 RepID=UPI00261788A5|nr:apolipoprotein N-acyltransferase [uncultured Algimonas sp.]
MNVTGPGRVWDARGWGPRLLVPLAGALAALGFAPFHIWGVTLLALAVLFVRLIGLSGWERPGRAGFRTGLLFGLGWFSASCFWIASAFIERGPEFIPMIPPLVGGLAVLLSLFWGAAAAVTAKVAATGYRGWAATAFVAAFTLAELARGHVLSGFPWNMAAYAFEPGGWISQSAHWIGVYGLTMVAYGIAAGLGLAWTARRVRPALASGLVLAGLFGLGALRLQDATRDIQPGVVLRLVAVPFRQSEKIDPATAGRITDAHIAISLAPGLDRVSHLVWPEGAVNGLATENEGLLRFVGANLAAVTNDPPVWLMNSLREEVKPDRSGTPRRHYYNSSVAILFDDDGNPAVAGVNDKKKLVPFGEFIPGGEIVERIGARIVSTALGSITPAPEKRVAHFPGLPPISPQICYEVIFPGLTPGGEPRPQAILNQSNDAWFGSTTGPAQHAAIARYRAIEEGLPLIRSAANGISGVFDAHGRADRILDGKTAAHIDVVLPVGTDRAASMLHINSALLLINVGLLLLACLWAGHYGRKGGPGSARKPNVEKQAP